MTKTPTKFILSPADRNLFVQLKNVVKKGMNTFVEVGNALIAIKEKELYCETYGTFEKFCQVEFKMHRTYAYRLMEGAKTAEVVSPAGDKVLNENVVRPLGGLPPRKKLEIFEEAEETASKEGRQVTSTDVKAALEADKKDKKEPVLDAIGRRIPANLLPIWEGRGKITTMLTGLTKLKTDLKTAEEQEDPVFGALNFQMTLGTLDQLYHKLKYSMPYAVCGLCNGAKCKACKTGIMSKHGWELQVPAETKAMILKKIK